MNDLNDLLAAYSDIDDEMLLESMMVSVAEDAAIRRAAIKHLVDTLKSSEVDDSAKTVIAGAVLALVSGEQRDADPLVDLVAGWPEDMAHDAAKVAEACAAEGEKIGNAYLASDGFSTTSGGWQ